MISIHTPGETKRETKVQGVCQAEGCGTLIVRKVGRPAAYCSSACRLRAFRALRKRF